MIILILIILKEEQLMSDFPYDSPVNQLTTYHAHPWFLAIRVSWTN